MARARARGEIVDIHDQLAQTLELQVGLMKVLEGILKREDEQLKSQKWYWLSYNVWVVFRDVGYLIVTGYCANLIAGRHGVYLDRDKCFCICDVSIAYPP